MNFNNSCHCAAGKVAGSNSFSPRLFQVVKVVCRVVTVTAVWKLAVDAGGMRLTVTVVAGCDGGMLISVTVHAACRAVLCRCCLQFIESSGMTGSAQIIGSRCRVLQQSRLMRGVTGGAVGYRHVRRM